MKFKKLNVLVTGAGGFIGSHLVERLIKEKFKVRAFVRYNSSNSWGWIDSFPKNTINNLEIFTGDIRDPNGVREAVKDIDIIFHLAALIGIPFSYHSPDSYVDTNIKGTLNILQAAKSSKVKKVLITSTSEVYGTAQYVPIDEKHPKQGQSPYSATKIAADYLTESFYRSFGLPVVIVRPFNTYGPRQSARAVIPTIITQILEGKKQINLGSLHPTRDLLYVKDTVEGFVEIAKSDNTIGKEINIATQKETSIGDLAKIIIHMLTPDTKIKKDHVRVRPHHSEVERLMGKNEKIRQLTNWAPRYSLEKGLMETIQWFREGSHLRTYKSNLYNV